MVPVLADPDLYSFTGGLAPSLDELRCRYAAQTVGESAEGSQWWLNWVVRHRRSGHALGFVQATVEERESGLVADLAWVIGRQHQGHGFASEASEAMIGWLREHGVLTFVAYIHPDHRTSIGVAEGRGFTVTSETVDGEVRWIAR